MADEWDSRSKQAEKYFDTAADVRKFEIGLVWKRSIFFWGFIGAAFVAYAELGKDKDDWSQLTVACFGLVCSIAWSLLNRGSKYWQEAWETKTERKEIALLGEKLFARVEPVQEEFWLLRARKYSVSRLVIALSDFTVLVWLALTLKLLPWNPSSWAAHCPWKFAMVASAVAYAVYMGFACRSSR